MKLPLKSLTMDRKRARNIGILFMTKIIVQISRQRGITINVKIVLKKIHQLYSHFIPSCKIINRNDHMSKTEKKRKTEVLKKKKRPTLLII